jgi:aspartate ammonia-lyase
MVIIEVDVNMLKNNLLQEQTELIAQFNQVQQLLRDLEVKLLKIQGKLELLESIEHTAPATPFLGASQEGGLAG